MAGLMNQERKPVFGLDIGTRSIVGTVGYQEGKKFHILGQCAKEHETRAMLDGQIHDIGAVAESIREVCRQLRSDLNMELTDVCIAAAGRVLRTVTVSVEQEYEADKVIGSDDIFALSMAGVEKAYAEFQKTNDSDMKFYCVGYTPMRYYMNGYQISNLEGHKASKVSVDMIATFLPDDVVDGLYKAVELADLHVANLTLEPIAAIQIAIPEKFRMLNLALVDVGAGTSDISITSEGAISAYGMIPVAGDSLTDLIVQHCLVEFETAEKIKRSYGSLDVVEYEDILGLPMTITREEVAEVLAPAIDKMTTLAAEEIRRLNGDKPVSAVFVVGGGGMVPGYTEKLSEKLGIPAQRVAIRGEEVMQNIVFEIEDAKKNSLMVTPIGICLSFYEQSNNFIFLEFNNERLKLYDNGHLTVADAAASVEYANENLFPKRGKALTFKVNGAARIIRGQQGEAAEITINGAVGDLYSSVNSGDIIEVKASTAGEDAKAEILALPEFKEPISVIINGNTMEMPKTAVVNGKLESGFYSISEGDDIRINNYITVEEICSILDLPLSGAFFVNGTTALPTTRVYDSFTIDLDVNRMAQDAVLEAEQITQENAAKAEAEAQNVQAETETASKETRTKTPSEEPTEKNTEENKTEPDPEEDPIPDGPVSIHVIVNGEFITLTGKNMYVFVDVFDYISFDLTAPKGKSIVTNLNGRNAEYMERLHEGDKIDIYWK